MSVHQSADGSGSAAAWAVVAGQAVEITARQKGFRSVSHHMKEQKADCAAACEDQGCRIKGLLCFLRKRQDGRLRPFGRTVNAIFKSAVFLIHRSNPPE